MWSIFFLQVRSLFLYSLNLEITRNSFVAVVGPVGCGKSSLLSAIMSEMPKINGSMSIGVN